jgi:hypothetical protein
VGGVAGIALIAGAIAFFVIRSRKRNNNVGSGTAYSAVAPADTAYHGSPTQPSAYAASSASPQTAQTGYFSPSTTLHPETAYAGTPAPVAGMYDPRTSYYDPAKVAEQQQQQYGHTPPPGGYAAYPGQYPPQQQQPVSELDTSAVPAGHQSNPAEMAASSPR